MLDRKVSPIFSIFSSLTYFLAQAFVINSIFWTVTFIWQHTGIVFLVGTIKIRDTLTAILSLPAVVAHTLVPKSINACTGAMNAWATENFENLKFKIQLYFFRFYIHNY